MTHGLENCNSTRVKIIDDTKFNRIKDLLERDENLGPDEIAVVQCLYWNGVKLN